VRAPLVVLASNVRAGASLRAPVVESEAAGGGGGGWTPATPGGLLLWLQGDLGVTLDGGGVATWADQSGNGNDATQATPANRPTIGSGIGSGGRQTLVFNPTTAAQFLQCAVDLGAGAQTILVIWKSTVPSNGDQTVLALTAGAGHHTLVVPQRYNTNAYTPLFAAALAAGASITSGVAQTTQLTTKQVLLFTYDGSSPTSLAAYEANWQGSPVTVGTDPEGGWGTVSSAGLIGSNGAGANLSGEFALACAWAGILGSTDLTAALAYGDAKYPD
jgi:hypothetical protein